MTDAPTARYDLVSGGTDNHLMLINLQALKIDGGRCVHDVFGLIGTI